MPLLTYHIAGNDTAISSYDGKTGELVDQTVVHNGKSGLTDTIQKSGNQHTSNFVLASDLDQTILSSHSDHFFGSKGAFLPNAEARVRAFTSSQEQSSKPMLRNEEELVSTFSDVISNGGKIAIVSSNKHPTEVSMLLTENLLPKLEEKLGRDPSGDITVILGRARDVQRTSSKDEHFDTLHEIYGQDAKVVFLDDDLENVKKAREKGIHALQCPPDNSATMSKCLSEISQYAKGEKPVPQINPSLMAAANDFGKAVASAQAKPSEFKFDPEAFKKKRDLKKQGGLPPM